MASIERYAVGSGATRYSVRYRQPNGLQTKKRGFRTKRDAELFLANTEVRKATGGYVAPKLGRATIGDLAVDWLARKQQAVAATTSRSQAGVWRNHVAPHWASVPVASVDLLGVESWITGMLRGGAKASTVLKAYGALAGILDDAVKAKRLSSNPARGVGNLPKLTGKRHVYLTSDDVHRLADAAGEDNSALVLTLAYCGLRWGEAIALQVRDIEFLKRRLSVTRSATEIGGAGWAVSTPKSGKSRSVPVPEFVLDALSVQCAGKDPKELVFPAQGGGFRRHMGTTTGWFARAVRLTGIQRITPHDLRHTCASLAVSAGANVLAVSRMLGHAKPSMTLDVYSDLFDSDLDKVAAAMHGRYARGVPISCPQGGFGGS